NKGDQTALTVLMDIELYENERKKLSVFSPKLKESTKYEDFYGNEKGIAIRLWIEGIYNHVLCCRFNDMGALSFVQRHLKDKALTWWIGTANAMSPDIRQLLGFGTFYRLFKAHYIPANQFSY